MQRTTLSLPDDVADALRREARRRHTSASAVARDAIAAHLRLLPAQARPVPFAAVGRSGQRNVARDMEQLLAREWNDPGFDPGSGQAA
jgi:plasmid stability protein